MVLALLTKVLWFLRLERLLLVVWVLGLQFLALVRASSYCFGLNVFGILHSCSLDAFDDMFVFSFTQQLLTRRYLVGLAQCMKSIL